MLYIVKTIVSTLCNKINSKRVEKETLVSSRDRERQRETEIHQIQKTRTKKIRRSIAMFQHQSHIFQ